MHHAASLLPQDSTLGRSVTGLKMPQVVGGAERGGIILRTGYDLSSDVADSRLVTGSLVKDGLLVLRCLCKHGVAPWEKTPCSQLVLEETDSRDGRICYELLRGEGPASGWVSPTLRGKETREKLKD